MQKHTVGIVGGSDLVKIKEQLGDNGKPVHLQSNVHFQRVQCTQCHKSESQLALAI